MAPSNRLSQLAQQLRNHPIVVIVGLIFLGGSIALAGQHYLQRTVDPDAVANRLASDGDFVRLLALKLRHNPSFVDQVRGQQGPKGDAGEQGPTGEPPKLDSIVGSLADSESFIQSVSTELVEEHAERLRGQAGPEGPPGSPGQPGSISLSSSQHQRVVSVLVSNKAFIEKVARRLVGPVKPLTVHVQEPGSLSCGTVCNLEFGKADCRGGLVKTIVGKNKEVSCNEKVLGGETLSCYCAPPPR